MFSAHITTPLTRASQIVASSYVAFGCSPALLSRWHVAAKLYLFDCLTNWPTLVCVCYEEDHGAESESEAAKEICLTARG